MIACTVANSELDSADVTETQAEGGKLCVVAIEIDSQLTCTTAAAARF